MSKSNLPALPTSKVPMTFNNTISKDDLADLIIAMEEDKLYKIRDNNKKQFQEMQKQEGEDWKAMSDVIINTLPKDQEKAAKNFISAMKVLDPKGCDPYIYNISLQKDRVTGTLTNMLPSFFGLAPRGNCSIQVPISCTLTSEIKQLMKKIKDSEKLRAELEQQFNDAMHKIQDTDFYQRKVRAKVTAALLTDMSPADVMKSYTTGKMFSEKPVNTRVNEDESIDD